MTKLSVRSEQLIDGGDWRSRGYGADRVAHLFVYGPWGSGKRPACGVKPNVQYATAQRADFWPCRECLAAEA